MRELLTLLLICMILYSCSAGGDECSEYSHFNCKEIDNAEYNVYFYFPNGNEKYLGSTQGLRFCSLKAGNYAISKEMENDNWSYVCCMIANGSSCYEKHK